MLASELTPGSYTLETLTAVIPVGASEIGQNIGIAFGDTALSGSGGNFYFDNASLTYVPESSAMAMLTVGSLGLLFYRRRAIG